MYCKVNIRGTYKLISENMRIYLPVLINRRKFLEKTKLLFFVYLCLNFVIKLSYYVYTYTQTETDTYIISQTIDTIGNLFKPTLFTSINKL